TTRGHSADLHKPLTRQEREKLRARASELFQSGQQAYRRGALEAALAKMKESLQIREELYPKDRYPQGHSELALSLGEMGVILLSQGSYIEARGYLERALAMYQALYPKDRYPQGHPHLASSLNNLGSLLQDQGSYADARGYHERALAMRESLYPKARY